MSLSAEVKGLPTSSVELISSASDYVRAELHRNERLPPFMPPAWWRIKKKKHKQVGFVAPLSNLFSLPFQVNDFPNFLSGKDRELSQHIRITYVTDKPASRGRRWLRRDRRSGFPHTGPSTRRVSHCPTTHAFDGRERIKLVLCYDLTTISWLKFRQNVRMRVQVMLAKRNVSLPFVQPVNKIIWFNWLFQIWLKDKKFVNKTWKKKKWLR